MSRAACVNKLFLWDYALGGPCIACLRIGFCSICVDRCKHPSLYICVPPFLLDHFWYLNEAHYNGLSSQKPSTKQPTASTVTGSASTTGNLQDPFQQNLRWSAESVCEIFRILVSHSLLIIIIFFLFWAAPAPVTAPAAPMEEEVVALCAPAYPCCCGPLSLSRYFLSWYRQVGGIGRCFFLFIYLIFLVNFISLIW